MTPCRRAEIRRILRAGRSSCSRTLALLLGLSLLAAPAAAQQDGDDAISIFEDLGTATAVEDAVPAAPGQGAIAGQVIDAETGAPVPGVTVIVQLPPAEEGGAPRQEVRTTGPAGDFELEDVPPGRYRIDFVKAGYRKSAMTGFEVVPGEVSRADFPMPPLAAEEADQVLQLEAFEVEASAVEDILASLELRIDSDQLLNVMSAEELSKFAAGDVAEALKRVAGVNVQEGQFAIIRGLEDRYSSTLFNGAPVPSPDPDRQSVQLDLFPSDVVQNLVVSKTFSGEQPSNSAGGAIDIDTAAAAGETFELKIQGGTGYESKAIDRFLELEEGSPTGVEVSDDSSWIDVDTDGGLDVDFGEVTETDFGGSLGGRFELFGRELRFAGVFNREIDYKTAEGFQETREPRLRQLPGDGGALGLPTQPGGLASGLLELSGGLFDFTQSERSEQRTGFAALGLDLDEEGRHTIDITGFWTWKKEEIVELRENGHLPNFDYQDLIDAELSGDAIDARNDFLNFSTLSAFVGRGGVRDARGDPPSRGALYFSNFSEGRSFLRERELKLLQANGEHEFGWLEGLEMSWAANQAQTTQDETSRGAEFFFEPTSLALSFTRPPVDADHTPSADDFPVWPELLEELFPTPVESLLDKGFSQAQIDSIQALFGGTFLDDDGRFAANDSITFSSNHIEENQDFVRFDVEYESPPVFDFLTVKADAGIWYERAKRGVDSEFLEGPQVANQLCSPPPGEPVQIPGPCSVGAQEFALFGDSLEELGGSLFDRLLCVDADGTTRPCAEIPGATLANIRGTTNESSREIEAYHFGLKATLWERLDLLGSFRLENIVIESNNDPFTGEFDPDTGVEKIFPSRFLFFDRFDNPTIGVESLGQPAGLVFNDQILNVAVPSGPCIDTGTGMPLTDPGTGEVLQCVDLTTRAQVEELVNGTIDERYILPSAGIAWRPLQGLSLRGAFSRTVARPSFREMGYYVSVEPGSDDLTVGNPQLQLSEVTSYDTRAEYTWGERGDLLAASAFYKTIEDPIESIVVRDPTNAELSGSALFRTFFNNPNEATLWGIEVEARKSFGFLGAEFLSYLSVGGNLTYIDAEVDRSEAERIRSSRFFGVPGPEGTPVIGDFGSPCPANPATGEVAPGGCVEKSRRLFAQPEWIANADVTFDHPDWGTRVTVAFFAISDVLDAAGSVNIGPAGQVLGFTLDRYVDAFHQLDVIASQTFRFDLLPGEATLPSALTFKASVKNVTDSKRRILYDPEQTDSPVAERSFRVGLDYSFSATYSFSF